MKKLSRNNIVNYLTDCFGYSAGEFDDLTGSEILEFYLPEETDKFYLDQYFAINELLG